MQVARAKSAVQVVQELATDDWRKTAAETLSSHLGDEFWAGVDHEWRPGHCKGLAKAARKLSRVDPKLAGFDSVLGRQTIKSAVSKSKVACVMVDRVVSAHTQIPTVVTALRTAGIILCVLNDCIVDCRCLKDLADENGLQLQALEGAFVGDVCSLRMPSTKERADEYHADRH